MGRGRFPCGRTWRLGLALTIGAAWGCLAEPPPSPASDPPPPPAGGSEPRFAPWSFDAAFRSPVRLAVTPGGALLVTDSRLGVVAQLEAGSLAPVAAALVRGKPLAVGYLNGWVYVGNATAGTVDVLDGSGSAVMSFGRGAVRYPTDLAVDERLGRIYVVDGAARAVKVFSYTGAPIRTIGSAASLQSPVGIALDRTRREVLVSDYGTADGSLPAAVKIFDYDGAFVTELSGRGTCGSLECTGGFSRPQGLAVDAAGRIYLADGVLAAVLVYDRVTGTLLETLGGRGVAPNLRMPSDVAIGPNGDVFVTSNVTGRVEVFPGQAAVR